MKLDRKHLVSIILALLWVVFFSACSKEQTQENVKEVLDTNLVKDAAAYKKAVTERRGSDNVTFSIEAIKRTGELVTVTVKGGCSVDSFQFIWDGLIAESYPMQTWLVLVHNKGTNQCQQQDEFELTLNLKKLFDEEVNLEEYVFHIANGSIEQDASLNTDGAVTITP